MPLIQVPKAVTPCQVDIPETVTNRSCEGAIHIKPGTKRITPEEWAVVQVTRPDVAKVCRVVPFDETKSKGALLKAASAKEAEKNRPKPLLPKQAKNSPTRRQRRLAGLPEPETKLPSKPKFKSTSKPTDLPDDK